MNKSKKIMAWVHWDLDGVLCYLLLKWIFPNVEVEYKATTAQNFRDAYTTWLSQTNINNYEKIFIMDLCVVDNADLVDNNNIIIIDHHDGHNNKTYKKAKTIIKTYSSACMLAYKFFKKAYNINLSKEKLHLLLLADDYDSYKFQLKDSYKLNIIFWETDNKFESFVNSFINGFHGFNMNQLNIINLHNNIIDKMKRDLIIYSGVVTIQEQECKVCATFSDKYINDVADILLNDYNADIALVVNVKTNHVSYRRSKTSTINLSTLAKVLGDGAGHEYSSGSKITDNVVMFTKLLKIIKK